MLFDDTFRTISHKAEGTFSDRGSKFIGYAFPVSGEEAVKSLLAGVRAEHPKARHCCWALRLSPDRSVFRIQDDGEPAGSAGRPILNVLLSRDLTNVLVVVVRYFGGTLLGIPGLINAYRLATEYALNEADIQELFLTDTYEISFDYADMNSVMRIVKEEPLSILQQEFDNRCILRVAIRKSLIGPTLARFEKVPSVNVKFVYG